METVVERGGAEGAGGGGGEWLPKCPRCGAPYRSLRFKTVAGRRYVYAYHGKQGKRQLLCYLGPAEGYVHAEHVLALGLDNLEGVDLLAVAMAAVLHFAGRFSLRGPEERRWAAEQVRALAGELLEIASELER